MEVRPGPVETEENEETQAHKVRPDQTDHPGRLEMRVHQVKTDFQGWQDVPGREVPPVFPAELGHRVSPVSWVIVDCQGPLVQEETEEKGERWEARVYPDQWERQDSRVLPVLWE